jgi:hypothetical protein
LKQRMKYQFSPIFSKSFHYFLPYFPYHFTTFFRIFHIFSLFSSIFSISFHYLTWVSSVFFISFHYFLPYFLYHFIIQLTLWSGPLPVMSLPVT